MSRWIVADDFDASIAYAEGTWLGVRGIFNSTEAGVSVQNAVSKSAHKLTTSGRFVFPFNGTEVAAFGVSSALGNSTAGGKATIECFIDGQSIGGRNPIDISPWASYCGQGGLTDGLHHLAANITADAENPFWLDFIRYTPSEGASVANKVVMIDSSDPGIQYASDGAWGVQGSANVTSTGPAKAPVLTVDFTGVSLTWYSLSASALSTLTGKDTSQPYALTATIDGKESGIALVGMAGDDFSYNKILFETADKLPSGKHTFALEYFNPVQDHTDALSLDFLLINTGSTPATISGADLTPTVGTGGTVPTVITTVGAGGASTTITMAVQGSSTGLAPSATPSSMGFRNDATSGGGVALAFLVVTLARMIGW